MAGKRVQVIVPHAVAAKWEIQAELMGVSVSAWVAMMVARDDTTSDAHIEMLRRTDTISRNLDALTKALASRNDGYVRTLGRIESALHSQGGESE